MKAALPEKESERLRELREFNILDTLSEQAYDDITHLASQICGTPIALISLVDEKRQWFKSRVGLDAGETSRDLAFCAHAILQPGDLMVVPDASEDERFSANPLVVSDPRIRFYAGAPLVTSGGAALGTLCVIDREPREMTASQKDALRALSRQVMAQLELRRAVAQLQDNLSELRRYERQLQEYQRQLENANDELQQQSLTDALTRLNNRRAFEERLDQEFDRAFRYKTELSLLLFDIDSFKEFNDAFGHPAGDEVLERVGALLKSGLRKSDFLSRYGGEEFAAILPNTNADGAFVLAERCRRAVETASWKRRLITVSVGISTLSSRQPRRSALVAAADRALYQAKEEGRNRVCDGRGRCGSGDQ